MYNTEIDSINKPAKKLVVLIHGLGSDGNDLLSLVPLIQKELSDFHFYAPNGIESYDMAPYGYQWFSLQDRSETKIIELVEKNTPKLMDIIRVKQKELGLSNKDTVLIGFSQGTMMGLYLTLIQKMPFGAVVGFSGCVVPPELPINFKTPICLIHGENDNVINISEHQKGINYLRKLKIESEEYALPNLGHSINTKALELGLKFIKKYCEVE